MAPRARAAQPACQQSKVCWETCLQASVSPSAIGAAIVEAASQAGGQAGRGEAWAVGGSQKHPLLLDKCPALGSFSWPLAPGTVGSVRGKAQIWRDRRKLGEEQGKPLALAGLVGEELRPEVRGRRLHAAPGTSCCHVRGGPPRSSRQDWDTLQPRAPPQLRVWAGHRPPQLRRRSSALKGLRRTRAWLSPQSLCPDPWEPG